MDQTCISFDETRSTTIAKRGSRQINLLKPKVTGGSAATIFLSVSASGNKLPALVVFKGKPGATIDRKEIPALNQRYAPNIRFTVQHSNWCDESVMLRWVDEIWKPYTLLYTGKSILMLDHFACHTMGSVVKAIQICGTIVVQLLK